MNNPCLFKYIAAVFFLPVFVLFFAVNKTLNVNVVVVNTHPGQGLGSMSTERPSFYEKRNEADGHHVGTSKGKIILIIISACSYIASSLVYIAIELLTINYSRLFACLFSYKCI